MPRTLCDNYCYTAKSTGILVNAELYCCLAYTCSYTHVRVFKFNVSVCDFAALSVLLIESVAIMSLCVVYMESMHSYYPRREAQGYCIKSF